MTASPSRARIEAEKRLGAAPKITRPPEAAVSPVVFFACDGTRVHVLLENGEIHSSHAGTGTWTRLFSRCPFPTRRDP